MGSENSSTIISRFSASFVANLFRGGISLITGILLARSLGPIDFGRMTFLLVSFAAFKQLLDMGSTTAFFTFLSQKPRGKQFVRFFWKWICIQFIVSLVIIGIILPDFMLAYLWEGESKGLILLALVATFMQGTIWVAASQMAEANRQTYSVQVLNTLVVIIHFFVVALLWWFGKLAIPAVFIALAIEWGIAARLASKLYWLNNQDDENEKPLESFTSIFAEFWVYCLPFIPYVWLSFTHDFADRWMLQNWGGPKEQAYYSVAFQFSSIALLATSSILRIFWKEISEANHNGNLILVKELYHKASRGLYFIGALVAGGLLPWTSEIIRLTLGSAYLGGSLTMMLMFIYPVHQSNGQICNTMFYATGRSRIQVLQGIVFMFSSIVTVYFMLAPKDAYISGLALGSMGLAYKMVLLQIIFVNFQAWVLARIFKWEYDWKYQIASLFSAITIGSLVRVIVLSIINSPIIVSMVVSGIIYIIFMAFLVCWQPWIIGFERSEIALGYNKLLKVVNFKNK